MRPFHEQQAQAMVQHVSEPAEEKALPRLTERVDMACTRLGDITATLSHRADEVFGAPPPSPVPPGDPMGRDPGALGNLSASIGAVERLLNDLESVVSRFDRLA